MGRDDWQLLDDDDAIAICETICNTHVYDFDLDYRTEGWHHGIRLLWTIKN